MLGDSKKATERLTAGMVLRRGQIHPGALWQPAGVARLRAEGVTGADRGRRPRDGNRTQGDRLLHDDSGGRAPRAAGGVGGGGRGDPDSRHGRLGQTDYASKQIDCTVGARPQHCMHGFAAGRQDARGVDQLGRVGRAVEAPPDDSRAALAPGRGRGGSGWGQFPSASDSGADSGV